MKSKYHVPVTIHVQATMPDGQTRAASNVLALEFDAPPLPVGPTLRSASTRELIQELARRHEEENSL